MKSTRLPDFSCMESFTSAFSTGLYTSCNWFINVFIYRNRKYKRGTSYVASMHAMNMMLKPLWNSRVPLLPSAFNMNGVANILRPDAVPSTVVSMPYVTMSWVP